MASLFDLVAQAGEAELSRQDVEPALSELVREAEAVGVEAPLPALARNIAQRLAGEDDPAAAVRSWDAAELWLATACGAGDRAALELVEQRYIAPLRRGLAHMQLDDDALDDVLQAVRGKLLMPGPDGTTRLEQSAGTGRLANFVRVVAVRVAVDQLRGEARRPERTRPADALMDVPLPPDLQLHKERYRSSFKTAFEAAVAELAPRKRGVLRMHLLDRLGIDDIAALHGVHRSSAARWLAEVRAELGRSVRRRLRAELKLAATDFESLWGALESQLDLSFPRLLSESAEADE